MMQQIMALQRYVGTLDCNLTQNQVNRFLSDHDDRRRRTSRYDLGNHRCINDPQVFDSYHPKINRPIIFGQRLSSMTKTLVRWLASIHNYIAKKKKI